MQLAIDLLRAGETELRAGYARLLADLLDQALTYVELPRWTTYPVAVTAVALAEEIVRRNHRQAVNGREG